MGDRRRLLAVGESGPMVNRMALRLRCSNHQSPTKVPNMKDKNNCYNCAYKGNVPGSAHSTCSFNFVKAEVQLPRANPHGISSGWFNFPIDFDPVWIEGECKAFSKESDNNLKIEPVMNLIQLMRRC